MSQTRRQSLMEAVVNTTTGYIISLITQLLVFPFFGVHMALSQNMLLVGVFTIISIVRSYVWRRVFNYLHRPRA